MENWELDSTNLLNRESRWLKGRISHGSEHSNTCIRRITVVTEHFNRLEDTVWCPYNAVIFPKSSQRTPLSSPVRPRYGVSVVILYFDLCNISVTTVLRALSCHIGSHYNGTRLYNHLYRCIQIYFKNLKYDKTKWILRLISFQRSSSHLNMISGEWKCIQIHWKTNTR